MSINLTPTRETLIQVAQRLPLEELTDLVQDLLQLKAQRQAPVLPSKEAELLQRINQGLSPDQQMRYEQLIEKRRAETLTPGEHQKLMQLNRYVEQLNVARIEKLIELAQLRQVSLAQLMTELGIDEPTYVA